MTTQAAVVLAAGRGTRMKSQTPKVLHRVCGLEMVRLVVDAARAARLDPIVVVVPQDGAHIRSALKSGVSYAVQPEAMGTGHALLQAEPSLGSADQVTVLNGDVPLISSVTLSKLSEHHRRSGACVTLMVSTGANPAGMGRIVRSPTGAIVNVVEDEDTDEESRPIEEVNGGVYCFEAGLALEQPGLDAAVSLRRGPHYRPRSLGRWAGYGHRVGQTGVRDRGAGREYASCPCQGGGVLPRTHKRAMDAWRRDAIRSVVGLHRRGGRDRSRYHRSPEHSPFGRYTHRAEVHGRTELHSRRFPRGGRMQYRLLGDRALYHRRPRQRRPLQPYPRRRPLGVGRVRRDPRRGEGQPPWGRVRSLPTSAT